MEAAVHHRFFRATAGGLAVLAVALAPTAHATSRAIARVGTTQAVRPLRPAPCPAPSVTLRTIASREGGEAIALDGRTGRVAVLGNNYVDLLDSATGARLWRVPGGDGQHLAVGVDGADGHVFVASDGGSRGTEHMDGFAAMLDERTGAQLNEVGVGGLPSVVTVDEAMRRVFIANVRGATVSMLDARTRQVLRTITPAPGSADRIGAMTVDPSGRWVYLSGDTRIGVLDGATGAVEASFATPGPPDEGAATGTPVVDASTQHVFTTALLPDGRYLVAMFDARRRTRLRATTAPFTWGNLALDAPAGHVFAGSDNSVAMFGTHTGRLLRTTRAAGMVVGLADNPGMGLVFAAVERHAPNAAYRLIGPSQLNVLSACSGALLRTIRLGTDLSALAVDPRSGHIVALVDTDVRVLAVTAGAH